MHHLSRCSWHLRWIPNQGIWPSYKVLAPTDPILCGHGLRCFINSSGKNLEKSASWASFFCENWQVSTLVLREDAGCIVIVFFCIISRWSIHLWPQPCSLPHGENPTEISGQRRSGHHNCTSWKTWPTLATSLCTPTSSWHSGNSNDNWQPRCRVILIET